MSETTPAVEVPRTPMPAALSDELKTVVLAAADAHLAAVTADVVRLRDAVSHDLADASAIGTSEFGRLEGRVLAEFARLRADLTGSPHRFLLAGAGVVVAVAAVALGHFVVHLF